MKLNAISSFILAAMFLMKVSGIDSGLSPSAQLNMQVSTFEGTAMLTPFFTDGTMENTAVRIDWGDGTREKVVMKEGFVAHEFQEAGTYMVSVRFRTKGGPSYVVQGEISVEPGSQTGSVDLFKGNISL